MKNEYEKLCESVNNTLRQTKILRYPRQIQFSEEFTRALAKEVSRHMQSIDEANQPIRDLPEKFLKALRFELVELTESKKAKQKSLRPRQQWTINPVTRVHQDSKTVGYNRQKEKRTDRNILNSLQ